MMFSARLGNEATSFFYHRWNGWCDKNAPSRSLIVLINLHLSTAITLINLHIHEIITLINRHRSKLLYSFRHSRERGNPSDCRRTCPWIPAFAGMTV